MSHSFFCLKPSKGGVVVSSVDVTSATRPKNNIAVGNPAGDAGTVSKSNSLKSGSV